MPPQRSLRMSSALASVLVAAGLMLTAASCSGITPLGPDTPPKPVPATRVTVVGPMQVFLLGTPFVLEAMRIQDPNPAGGCPAGSVALSGGLGQCYRSLGTPLTVSTAQVSSVLKGRPPAGLPGTPAGLPGIPAGQSGFVIILPGTDGPAVKEITTTAADAHGYLSISVAGRTWLLARVLRPFTGTLQIAFPSATEVQQLQQVLVKPD